MGNIGAADLRVSPTFLTHLQAIVSERYLKLDEASRTTYGADALNRGRQPEAVVMPADTQEVAAVVGCLLRTRGPRPIASGLPRAAPAGR